MTKESRAKVVEVEKRALSFSAGELRIEPGKEGTPTRIVGYAAKFDVRSEPIFGSFREQIAKGAFKKNLPNADVRFLVNHDPGRLLGRTKSGTLTLSEDSVGLRFDVSLPETMLAKDTLELINRRDLDAMSFGFKKIRDSWGEDESGFALRTLEEVSIFDVSLATYAAYPDTEVALRELDEWRQTRTVPGSRARLRLRIAGVVD